MFVRQIEDLEQLESYQQQWDLLADGRIFRCWSWLSTWWKHYGMHDSSKKLSVLLLFDGPEPNSCQPTDCSISDKNENSLIAILPCYLESTLARGNILRLLGDGEVCSDYLGILSTNERIEEAARQLAQFLKKSPHKWDLAEFVAVDENNTGMITLINALHEQACHIDKKTGPNCWSIELPDDWEAFLAGQSKSHRKQLRRLERRVLASETTTWHLVDTQTDFDVAWSIFTDLHQRRRQSLGEPGCFASSRWASFHQDIAQQFLKCGKLRLSWVEICGQPIAAEYHFAGQSKTFAYQGGLDPDRLEDEPGKLSMILTLQHAIQEGHTHFDLLRGDEPYKPHWRAKPHASWDYCIVPPRPVAQWRYQAWTSLRRASRMARKFANLLG